jgi:hypothetical protein
VARIRRATGAGPCARGRPRRGGGGQGEGGGGWGSRKADKARVARLVQRIDGLRAVNAGTLETARLVEQLTPLLISINSRYKTHAGLRVLGLPDGDLWAAPVQIAGA